MEAFKALEVREDSVAVARLKKAGAIVLGKTNAPVALPIGRR
jgi:amidase